MWITEILREIWLFSSNNIKSSESFSKQPTQRIVIAAHNCHNLSNQVESKQNGKQKRLSENH